MNLLKNKNILIVGVANKHSIAAGIAQSMSENGANIALTYQNERLKNNVEKICIICFLHNILCLSYLITLPLALIFVNKSIYCRSIVQIHSSHHMYFINTFLEI